MPGATGSQSTGSQTTPPQGTGQSSGSAGTPGRGAPVPTVHITTPNGPVRIVTFGRGRAARPLAEMVMPIPADNPATDAKIALGRRLFFEARLSNDRSVSCATCHHPDRGFADDRALAIGVFGRVGKRHTPSLVNRGFGRTQFWDGRAATLETQVLQPIEDRNEMDLPMTEAVKRLEADASYRTAWPPRATRAPSAPGRPPPTASGSTSGCCGRPAPRDRS